MNSIETPLVSIVIPCRAGGDASTTLTSLSQQTYRRFSVVVVPDERRGANWARNEGFKRVSTPWVLFSDDDIHWRPRALERLVETLESHPEASYAYGNYEIKGIGIQCDKHFDAVSLRRSNFISTMSVIKTSRFPGFDESLRRFQDWDLWLTMLKLGDIGVYCEYTIFDTKIRKGITYGGEIDTDIAAQIIRSKHGLMGFY